MDRGLGLRRIVAGGRRRPANSGGFVEILRWFVELDRGVPAGIRIRLPTGSARCRSRRVRVRARRTRRPRRRQASNGSLLRARPTRSARIPLACRNSRQAARVPCSSEPSSRRASASAAESCVVSNSKGSSRPSTSSRRLRWSVAAPTSATNTSSGMPASNHHHDGVYQLRSLESDAAEFDASGGSYPGTDRPASPDARLAGWVLNLLVLLVPGDFPAGEPLGDHVAVLRLIGHRGPE